MQNYDKTIVNEENVMVSGNKSDVKVSSFAPGNGKLEYAGRTIGFDYLVTQSLPLPDYRARCHSVSYDTLCDGILYPINKCISQQYSPADVQTYLEGLRDAVFPNGEAALPVDHKRFYQGAVAAATEIITLLNKALNLVKLSQSANNLLSSLNNSIQNIREGSGIWNSSLQSAFDSKSWCYVDKNHQVISSQANPNINPPQPTAIFFPPGAPPDGGKGFYLTDPIDGSRLSILFARTRGSGKFHMLQGKTTDNRPFVFSSSNSFPFSGNYYEFNAKIFYLNNNVWTEFRV